LEPLLSGILDAARIHGVEGAVADNLCRLSARYPSLELPERVARNCNHALHLSVYNLLAWELEARRVLDLLSSSRLSTPMVLKGGASKYGVYPHPRFRPSLDLDLLMPANEVDQACRLLLKEGYSFTSADHQRAWTAWHGHHVALERGSFQVELHRSIDNSGRRGLEYHDLLPDSSPLKPLHPAALAPSMESQTLILTAHALKHGLHIPLRDLVDLHLLLTLDRLDWEHLCHRAQSLNLAGTLECLTALAVALFATRLPQTPADPARGLSTLARLLATTPWRGGFLHPPLVTETMVRKTLVQLMLTRGTRFVGRQAVRYLGRRWKDLTHSSTPPTS